MSRILCRSCGIRPASVQLGELRHSENGSRVEEAQATSGWERPAGRRTRSARRRTTSGGGRIDTRSRFGRPHLGKREIPGEQAPIEHEALPPARRVERFYTDGAGSVLIREKLAGANASSGVAARCTCRLTIFEAAIRTSRGQSTSTARKD